MKVPRALVLVGPRGAGKSTLGRALAAAAGWRFADGDMALAERAGESAAAHLQRVGEAAFRRLEAAVTIGLLQQAQRTVLALGGGAVLSAPVRRALRAEDLLAVLLVAAPTELCQRLRASTASRPPLTGLPLEAEVEVLLARRLPLYRAVARRELDTGRVGLDAAVAVLLPLLRES